jgi:rhomboid protease GluP
MPQCLKCGTELTVNEEGIAPVLCDRCAGVATKRARTGLATGTMRDYPATAVLIAINLTIFAAMLVTGGFGGLNLYKWGANYGPATLSGQYWRLVTAGFIHAGFLHVAFNMWCLWSLGQLCERLFGRWQTLVIYLLTGVGGSLLSIAYDPKRLEVGASGAIFGIAGAVLAGLKFGDVSISSWQRRSAISSLVTFVAFNFYLGQFGNTDNMCHLGGFVSGLIIGLPLGAFAKRDRSLQLAMLLATAMLLAAGGAELVKTHGHASRLETAEIALGERDYSGAIRILQKDIAANPDDAQAYALLGHAYALNNERENAIAAYKKALQLDPNIPDVRDDLDDLQQAPQSSEQR